MDNDHSPSFHGGEKLEAVVRLTPVSEPAIGIPEGCRSEKDPEGALTPTFSPNESELMTFRACLGLPTENSSYRSLCNVLNCPVGLV